MSKQTQYIIHNFHECNRLASTVNPSAKLQSTADNKEISYNDFLNNLYNQLQDTVRHLKPYIDAFKARFSALQQEIVSLHRQTLQQKQAYTTANKLNIAYLAKAQALRGELTDTKKQNEQLHSKLADQETKLLAIRTSGQQEVSQLSAELAATRARINELETALAESQQAIAEPRALNERLSASIAELEQQLAARQSEIDQLKATAKRTIGDQCRLATLNGELTAENIRLKQQLATSRAENAQLKQASLQATGTYYPPAQVYSPHPGYAHAQAHHYPQPGFGFPQMHYQPHPVYPARAQHVSAHHPRLAASKVQTRSRTRQQNRAAGRGRGRGNMQRLGAGRGRGGAAAHSHEHRHRHGQAPGQPSQ